jgi:RNA polymerase sigma factor (sigma-70 family)
VNAVEETAPDSASPCPDAAAAVRGDEAELFRRHHRRILAHVRRAASGAPEALVEDACLFAWLQLLRRQPDRELAYAWLCTVARREAWRMLRAAREVRSLDASVSRAGTGEGPDGADPLVECIAGRDTVEAAHAAREALRVLASLPDRQRRYLALKVAGHSYRENCALTGASYTTVNRHLPRARALVREAQAA